MRGPILAADLFCGAGGASTGLLRAAKALGVQVKLRAYNHWPTAVETHLANHPDVIHKCEALERVDPRTEVPGGRLNILLAGPECTHHSDAAGGRPINDQSRSTAWCVVKWAQELYIDTILIENVPGFRSWGPLGANGRPLKKKKGQTFEAYLNAFRSLDYHVEVRELVAADYGDATTRKRLFILCTRGNRRPSWPMPTHSKDGHPDLFGSTQKWRAAREIIDWSLKGKSIFDRKKPLAPATMQRILAGLERFGGPELQPFLVVLRNNMAGRSVDSPLPTVSAQGQHVGLATPFLVPVNHGQDSGHRPRPVDEPLPTLTARANQYLVESFVLGQQTGSVPRPTTSPLPTISTDGAIALVEPFMVPMYGERPTQEPRTHSVDEPVPTIPATGGGKFAVVSPVLIDTLGPSGPDEKRVKALDEPLGTVTGSNRFALARPFLTKYYGTATGAQSVDDPLDTIVGKDRIALVQPQINGVRLDIRFRMLQKHELSAAMSFPAEYVFTGTQEDIVKQIGNSWPGELARALCFSQLQSLTSKRPRVGKKECAA